MKALDHFRDLDTAAALGAGACVLLAVSLFYLARGVARTTPLPLPQGGQRGKRRAVALRSGVFRALDPILRLGGGLVRDAYLWARAQSGPVRARAERLEEFERSLLVRAGEPAGLDRFEAIFLSLLLGALGALGGAVFGAGESPWILPGFVVGGALFNIRCQSMAAERGAEVRRELPAAIDLASLSMNAGSDFPGAVRRVIDGQTGVIADELGQVLVSLELGITRRAALTALRERVPIAEVRDLVRAVILAEQKGASVAEALSQQAQVSRQQRSVRAEEAAARAGVLLLFPLMLLMVCVMILLVGPLVSELGL